MLLASLRVVHLPKLKRTGLSADGVAALRARLGSSFRLDTCQRELWVLPAGSMPIGLGDAVETLAGSDAYRFMLRVATGLESQVRGETDIFGQFKDAWQRFEAETSRDARELAPWVQKLFEDTKEIRSRFLQNTGGESYGSLVRKYLRALDAQAPAPRDEAEATVLLIGAGNLAQSVAPWLTDYRLIIANRTRVASERLRAEILAKAPHARVEVLADDVEEPSAWRRARHAVVCVPLDANKDPVRRSIWRESSVEPRSVIHLGTLRAQAGAEWAATPGFFALDDLFALQQASGEQRLARLERAAKACEEKALLRSLPGSPAGSATLPHGWEDLAAFG
jgi:hypothetical protein